MDTPNKVGAGAFSKAGLGFGTDWGVYYLGAAGVTYGIGGVAYSKAQGSEMLLTADDVQPSDTTCVYLIQIDAAGTLSSIKGRQAGNFSIGLKFEPGHYALQIPYPDADHCALGLLICTTYDGAELQPGVLGFNEVGTIYHDYMDFVGGMPSNPRIYRADGDLPVGVTPPTVDAGPSGDTGGSLTVSLDGTVTYGSDLSAPLLWTIVSGGTGTFTAATSVDTDFTADSAANYTFRLTATPDDGDPVSDTAAWSMGVG